MPNGRIINKPDLPGGSAFQFGDRVEPGAFQNQGSVLGDSLAQAGTDFQQSPFSHQLQHLRDYERVPAMQGFTQPYDLPPQDNGYRGMQEEQHQPQARSPPVVGLSTLDAPLPASFDSNGISFLARHGPVAASMPGAVGFESPTGSLPKAIVGQSGHARPRHERGSDRIEQLGTSPDPPVDIFGSRYLHSQRVPRSKGLSASLPRYAHQIDPGWMQGDEMPFGGDEDYVPSDLSRLMSPEERSRRLSGRGNLRPTREALAGLNTPGGLTSTKVGSPGHVGSPSRFSELFKKQMQEENGSSSPDFGPVGSPLRSSAALPGASPALRATPRNAAGSDTFQVSSPPRNSTVSALSQQLHRTHLSGLRAVDEPGVHGLAPPSLRFGTSPRTYYDRVLSSGSVSTKIDEDQPTVFSLDSLDDEEEGGNAHNRTPEQAVWGMSGIDSRRKSLLTQNIEKSRAALNTKEQNPKE